MIHKRGWPTVIKTFRTKRDAEDGARRTAASRDEVRSDSAAVLTECQKHLPRCEALSNEKGKEALAAETQKPATGVRQLYQLPPLAVVTLFYAGPSSDTVGWRREDNRWVLDASDTRAAVMIGDEVIAVADRDDGRRWETGR
jgi:hypothetical protein